MAGNETGRGGDARGAGRGARILTALRTLGDDLLELVFPRICVVCEQLTRTPASMVCARCWAGVRPFPRPLCDRCGHPRRGEHACAWCARLDRAIERGRSFCWMSSGGAEAIVYALKYNGWSRVAVDIACRTARSDLRQWAGESAVLVPVPLAPRRLRERGYNQSALLATALAREWRMRVEPVVSRVRETPSQTRLTAEQRLHNVADAFAVDPEHVARCDGVRFVLVDDVVTTGATLNACAVALASAGAQSIGFITFGRAPDPRAPSTP